MSEAEKTSADPAAYTSRMTLSDQARRIACFLTKLSMTIPVWIDRSRQRRALAELADRDGHLLADIGLSSERAHREAGKPFWVFALMTFINFLKGPAAIAAMRAKGMEVE